MKMSGRNIIAVLGFALLGVVVAGGFLLGMMFAFPGMKIGSMTAVDQRNTQTIYQGPEIMEILTSRNFIVESETVAVYFWMRKEGQGAKNEEDLGADARPEGSIVVEENATGVSFNSIKRTHIEWTRTSIGEEEYYRIKVLEPKGIIRRKTETRVYINLWRDSRVPAGTSTDPYNIILQNGKSIVRFGGDEVDPTAPEMLHIDTLTVNGAGGVYLPVTPVSGNKENALLTDIRELRVPANGVPVDARCNIFGGVEISGGANSVTLSTVWGALDITGDENVVTVENRVGDAVTWGAEGSGVPNGSLNIRGSCAGLSVWTTNAGIDVASVAGDVQMRTVNGGLHINEITNGGALNFTATGAAGVSVGAVGGAVTIPQMGLGAVNVSNVRGDVQITSDQINAGAVNVSFDPALDFNSNPTVDIQGYDGAISVQNIRGATNIRVRDWENGTGRANIYAHFKRVDAYVSLTANTGYRNGHETEGNITVDLNPPLWCVLQVIGSSFANNELGDGTYSYIPNETNGDFTYYLINGSTASFPHFVGDEFFWTAVGSVIGKNIPAADRAHITVKTSTRFYLK